jgi:serine/threonine-protein kinase
MSGFIGSNIGGVYSVLDLIGSGGMGTVYRGLHATLNRSVAIKVLHAAMQDRNHAERFLAEARLQASLRHPAIATLYDFMEFRGQGCIIMEFVEGPTLAEFLERHGPFAPGRALSILRQVSEAVHYLHTQGIVHRDLKPANIKLAPDGTVKLLDFGIASALHAGSRGQTRTVVGTYEYMAPECLAGQRADQRSDIWSLGVLSYEMLTARLPFKGTSLEDLSRNTARGDFLSPSSFNKQVNPKLVSLIARCLAKNPAGRFRNISDLQREIDRLNGGSEQVSKVNWHFGGLRKLRIPILVGAGVAAAFVAFHMISGPAVDNGATQADKRTINIDAANGPAEVYRDGKDLGATPVRIAELPGSHVSLLLKREGFADLPVDFDVTERTSYSYVMKESSSGR